MCLVVTSQAKCSSSYNVPEMFPPVSRCPRPQCVPYVNDELCCPLLSELDAEENLNKVSWILDSGASLHYTGDINDFIEYAPLEKPIKAATATTTSTDIIGVGTVLMTIEGSEHMIRVAPVYFVPDLSSHLLSLGVFLRRSGFTTKGDNQHITVMIFAGSLPFSFQVPSARSFSFTQP